MEKDPFQTIVEQFQSADKLLLSEALASGSLRHPTDTGTEREESVRRMLERFLPASCQVSRGGFLFNIHGDASKQIDIIVTAGLAPRFESLSKDVVVAPLEDTIGVAEVKSNLDKQRLFEALDNLAELPRLEDPQSTLSSSLKRPAPHFWWDWPVKMILAFKAVSKEVLLDHLSEYYRQHPGIPHENRVSLIYVVDQYTIHRMTPRVQVGNADGSVAENQPPPGDYHSFDNMANVAGLVDLVTQLQQRAFMARFMVWPYVEWVGKVVNKALAQRAE